MLRPKRDATLPEHRGHLTAPTRYGIKDDYVTRDRDRDTRRPSLASRLSSIILYPTRPLIAQFLRLPLIARIITFVIPLLYFIHFLRSWNVHIEVHTYKSSWVEQEILHTEPLAGCFTAEALARDGGMYNVSERIFGPRKVEVHPGMDLRLGMDCYDFAGTIPYPSPPTVDGEERPKVKRKDRRNYHTYWRADLEPFGPRQEWMLKSFVSTQDLHTSTLILWTNDALPMVSNHRIALFLSAYPEAFEVREVDLDELATGTALDGHERLRSGGKGDAKAWVDGDLVRLLVLWKWGGVWVDMDSLLTRDLSPLLEHEFVTQWDCYDKIYQPLNGALMHFHAHSPYLCEAFHIMASPTNPAPRPHSTDWGSLLYHKLYRRLLASSIPPFQILPWCFSDARSCRMDNRLPDPFEADPKYWANGRSLKEGGELDETLRKVFGVHLHNQWSKAFPKDGWIERLLLRRYTKHLPVMITGAEAKAGKD